MTTLSSSRSEPIVLASSTEAQVYGFVTLALALTLVGTYIGMQYAAVLFSTGILLVCLFAELALVFTSRWWVAHSPLNIFLFGLFPLLSGFTLSPYIMAILAGYVNGGSIIINALGATVCMVGAAAVFARTTRWNLGIMGKALFFGLIGLLVLGILQIFIPSLQTGPMELLLSGAGILIFAGFTAYDMQRIQALSRTGTSPIILALSLYLDIFNLFVSILRFMLALSGNRRR